MGSDVVEPTNSGDDRASSPETDGAGDAAISCRGVVKRFGTQTVLKGVNLDIRPGETMVVMGGSGSGKSTLLRTIIGSHTADEGTIHILGHQI